MLVLLITLIANLSFAQRPFDLTIKSARGLANKDSGIIQKQSDPFVNIFAWGPGTNNFLHRIGSTDVISDDLTPTWNEIFTFSNNYAYIYFEVMDHDNIFQGDYEHLGTTDPVSLMDLPCGVRNDLTLDLLDGGGSNPTIDVAITTFNCPQPTAAPITSCYPQGPCDSGYMDKTNGNYENWACGVNCQGGQHITDSVCNCACIPQAPCPTPSPTPRPTTKIPTRDPTFEPCNVVIPDKDECITTNDCINGEICNDRILPDGSFHEVIDGDICDPNCLCYCL